MTDSPLKHEYTCFFSTFSFLALRNCHAMRRQNALKGSKRVSNRQGRKPLTEITEAFCWDFHIILSVLCCN